MSYSESKPLIISRLPSVITTLCGVLFSFAISRLLCLFYHSTYYVGNLQKDFHSLILIRLDDKIGRIKSNTDETPRTNDVADIIGYCVLLLISMGVSAEDIAKFKD